MRTIRRRGPAPKPVRMNFKFTPDTRDALEYLADKKGLTFTEVVEGLIERSALREGIKKAASGRGG